MGWGWYASLDQLVPRKTVRIRGGREGGAAEAIVVVLATSRDGLEYIVRPGSPDMVMKE